jgi:hypothetical protein
MAGSTVGELMTVLMSTVVGNSPGTVDPPALVFNFRELSPDKPVKGLKFPEVEAVSTLIIRRQFYRDIATPSLIKILSESFRFIAGFNRENWRIVKKTSRRTDDARYAPDPRYTGRRINYLLYSALPTSLKRLNLFENFHPYLHGGKDTKQPRSSKIQILPSLAISAPNLEHLSISFLTDAIDCLGLRNHIGKADIADHVTAPLPNLRSIALTSQEFLRPTQDRVTTKTAITNLLEAAAAATTRLPRLEIMEIWNWEQEGWLVDQRGRACVFRCEMASVMGFEQRRPMLTLQTNWGTKYKVKIGDRAIDAWEAVVCSRTNTHSSPWSLVSVEKPLPQGDYRNYGAVLNSLRLRNLILEPRSLLQAQFDANTMDEWSVEVYKPA